LYEEEVGGIDGIRVCRNAPSVSHLLFADDSLILMKADMNNATSLQRSLDTYCANSGQMVSLAKSSIFFSPNTNALLRAEICEALHIDTEALSDKYLGLPALVGADRSDCFKHFIERIIERINGWKEKQLSLGGKRDSPEGSGSGYPGVCYVGFPDSERCLQKYDGCYIQFLVGG
jgi:hypothetical protein